jgi:hypothetical protein
VASTGAGAVPDCLCGSKGVFVPAPPRKLLLDQGMSHFSQPSHGVGGLSNGCTSLLRRKTNALVIRCAAYSLGRKSTETQFHPGSNPLAFNRGAASGPVRNLMSEFAASGDLLAPPIAAAKTLVLARSPGNGPTNCAPATGTISEPCAIPSSAPGSTHQAFAGSGRR